MEIKLHKVKILKMKETKFTIMIYFNVRENTLINNLRLLKKYYLIKKAVGEKQY